MDDLPEDRDKLFSELPPVPLDPTARLIAIELTRAAYHGGAEWITEVLKSNYPADSYSPEVMQLGHVAAQLSSYLGQILQRVEWGAEFVDRLDHD